MIRARSCSAAAFFLGVIGVMVISTVAFSQTIPTNWEVRYLNLKDSLRAMAIDPLDPKIVFIGSDLAVIGTTDGGETWIAGESFRTASFSVTGAVGAEAMEILTMIKDEDTAVGAEEALEAGTEQEGLTDAAAEAEGLLADREETAAVETASVEELEAELALAGQAGEEADAVLAAAEEAAAAWEPETITASDVDGLSYDEDGYMATADYDQLESWLDERGLPVADDAAARQDELKNYLSEHALEGERLNREVTDAASASADAAALVAELEERLTAAQTAMAEAAAELERAEEEAAALAEEAGAVPEELEESVAFEDEAEEETIDLQLTGINYLIFDPAASEKLYLAAFDGVYKSEDTGATWEKIYTGPNPPQSAVLCLTVDPSDPDAIFAGTLSGLARSSDGGATWERPPGRLANMVITRIAVHPFDSRIVLAATVGYGIFKSTDGGNEWRQVLTRAGAGANRVLAVEFAPSQPEVIYAGTMSGIYKSLDGGESWDPATGMGISPTVRVRDLVVSPINPDLVVIATNRSVFGTTNGGGLWRRLGFGTNYEGGKILAFDPLNPNTIWLLTGDRVLQSAAPRFLDLSSGEEMILSGGSEFTLDGRERHSIVIEEIDEETGEIRITIQSDPQTVGLKIGETTTVDLTGDGQDDLSLTLESLAGGVPRLKVVRIAPASEADEDGLEALLPPDRITSLEDLEPYFRAEPTWVEVQQAAGRWAEVHPEKIAAWRSGASLRALIPRIDLDYRELNRRMDVLDQREQYSYSRDYYRRNFIRTESDLDEGQQFQTAYTYSSTTDWRYDLDRRDYELERAREQGLRQTRTTDSYGERFQESKQLTLRDDKQWGLALRWDLGDFLYNREQLRISTEARRLVELRQDVVEQVTLYYFDRRTARIDMILNPPADPYSRVEMLLQIQQLDASLDAMTGGYFTQTIKERENRRRR